MRDDRIVKWLEGIKDRAFADQPIPFSAFIELIELLESVFCEHKFTVKRMGGSPMDAESNEQVSVCEKCGYEQ